MLGLKYKRLEKSHSQEALWHRSYPATHSKPHRERSPHSDCRAAGAAGGGVQIPGNELIQPIVLLNDESLALCRVGQLHLKVMEFEREVASVELG